MRNINFRRIRISYYFNDENINLSEIHDYLNQVSVNFGLSRKGWKFPFKMNMCTVEE